MIAPAWASSQTDAADAIQIELLRKDNDFVLADWPDSARLSLKAVRETIGEQQAQDLLVSNLQFCKTLAKQIGQSMGLSAKTDARCAPNSAERSASGLMLAVDEVEDASGFFANATLSQEELRVLLAPGCKSLRNK